MKRAALALALAPLLGLALTGCRSVAEAPPDLEAKAAYQTVANQLPAIDMGWGDAPAIARMAASERGQPAPRRPEFSCDERRLKLYLEVLHPRVFDLPYDAIEQVTYRYAPMPNGLFCVVFPFLQFSEVRVAFDARKVEGLLGYIEDECARLERISPEIGLSGPWDHAMAVRSKCRDDARELGEGRLTFELSYASPVPPWIPYTARARHVAEAFAWVRDHAHAPPGTAPRKD